MKKYFLIFITVFFLISCAHKTQSSQAVVNDLSGKWLVLTVNGVTVKKADAGKEIPYLEFNTITNTVTGTTGCNRFNGKATIATNSINFGPLATTMMACSNAQYERPILQTLIGNLSYTYEKGIVAISKEGKNVMTLGK